jgi:hypothetical protein
MSWVVAKPHFVALWCGVMRLITVQCINHTHAVLVYNLLTVLVMVVLLLLPPLLLLLLRIDRDNNRDNAHVDVAATFKGIIRAIRELAPAMKAANVRLFVRRGGPNYQQGLAAMKVMGEELGLPVEVYGPESSMTGICAAAIEFVKSFDK